MPVNKIALDSRLQVRYQVGINSEGNPLYSTRTVASVKSDSDDEGLWTIASSVAGLQKNPVAEVRRVDYSVLTEE